MLRLLGLVLLWSACVGAEAAEVTALTIDPSAAMVDLSTSTYLLEDPEGTFTIEDVRKPANASRFQLAKPNPGFTPSAYWMRIALSNPTDKPLDRWFDTGNRTLQEVDLYAPDAGGNFTRQSTGSTHRFGERPLPTSTFVFPVSFAPQQSTELLLRVRSKGYLGVAVMPAIWKPAAYAEKNAHDTFVWTVMFGIALGLFIVNLMLYFYLKDISYLLYALSLASIVWSASSSTGGFGPAYEYFWPNMPLLEQSLWVSSVLALAVFPVLFCMHLLDFRSRHPTLRRVMFALMSMLAIAIGAQVVGTLLQVPDSARLLQLAYLVGSVAWTPIYPCAIFGVIADLRRANRVAKFIAIAFAPVMVATSILAYQGNVGQPMSWTYAIPTAVWEWFVMALLLADRFSLEVKAKLGAQAEKVLGLQQSERELEAKVAKRTEQLAHSEAKAKDLLHNMLPVDIAAELSNTGTTHPVRHESATVLFTDFAGFTQAASTMPADQMVAELNEVFAAFDDICDEESIEKIKTIGDAYMAAGGVPKACADHAQRCVKAGLRMIAFMHARNLDSAFKWSLRVGIHSGPVVAGVVGKRKFAFDIWGDTVNIASRMESAGEAGKVNVSAYTYHLIRKDFECTYRGKLDAKGKGEVDMYFVVGAASPTTNVP